MSRSRRFELLVGIMMAIECLCLIALVTCIAVVITRFLPYDPLINKMIMIATIAIITYLFIRYLLTYILFNEYRKEFEFD